MKWNHSGFLKTGLFRHEQKMSEKTVSAVVVPPEIVRKRQRGSSITIPVWPSLECFYKQAIWSRAMLWSAQTAHENKSDRLRDTLVKRTTTKHTTAYFEDSDQEHETAEHGLFMLSMKWGRAALHWWNKVTGKEKVNCQSMHESVYRCVCVWGVLQPNSRVQRHSCHKYTIKVLQSLEEHFVTACTLVKPHG